MVHTNIEANCALGDSLLKPLHLHLTYVSYFFKIQKNILKYVYWSVSKFFAAAIHLHPTIVSYGFLWAWWVWGGKTWIIISWVCNILNSQRKIRPTNFLRCTLEKYFFKSLISLKINTFGSAKNLPLPILYRLCQPLSSPSLFLWSLLDWKENLLIPLKRI